MMRAFCLDEVKTLLEIWLKQLERSPSVALLIFVINTSSHKGSIIAAFMEETGMDIDVDFISGLR